MIIFNKELQYLPAVLNSSAKYGVPAALILGHMRQESAFNPTAYRAEPQIGDGSTGLLQLLLGTAKTMNSSITQTQLYDPNINIDLGTQYMAKNLARYGGNIQDAIAAYNAGSVFKNTSGQYTNSKGVLNVQDYVNRVYQNYLDYSKWLSEGPSLVSLSTVNPILLITFGAVVIAALAGGILYARKR